MESKMDEFREFVKKYPKVREDVTNKNKTWQQMYEDYVLLGEDDPVFSPYKVATTTKKPLSVDSKLTDLLTSDNLKTVMGYVKKLNPDSISKTLGTVQKVLQITQGFQSKPSSLYNANYNSWWE